MSEEGAQKKRYVFFNILYLPTILVHEDQEVMISLNFQCHTVTQYVLEYVLPVLSLYYICIIIYTCIYIRNIYSMLTGLIYKI